MMAASLPTMIAAVYHMHHLHAPLFSRQSYGLMTCAGNVTVMRHEPLSDARSRSHQISGEMAKQAAVKMAHQVADHIQADLLTQVRADAVALGGAQCVAFQAAELINNDKAVQGARPLAGAEA